jgi:hypothetical protein
VSVLAHGSGIDDLIVLVAAVGTFLLVSGLRRRRGADAGAAASDRCPYCDSPLEPDAVRCDGCGFLAPRNPARPG